MAEMQVDIVWDGKRWQFPNHPVEIVESIDILANPPRYSPRRFRTAVDMGDVIAYIAAGHAVGAIQCMISRDGRVRSSAPVVKIDAGRQGDLTVLHVADAPGLDKATIPPERPMAIRFIDEAATDELNAAIDFRNMRRRQALWSELLAPDMPGWKREGNEFTQETHGTVYDERIRGMIYPLIFGNPGREVTSAPGPFQRASATRAFPIDDVSKYLMVAGHLTTNGTIRVLQDGSATGVEVLTTETAVDDLGRSITQIDVSAAATITYVEGDTYTTAWNGTASGLPNNAADVLGYLAAHTEGIRVDLASLETVAERLAGYTLDRYIDEPASPWRMLLTEVLPLVPVALVPTSNGVGFVWLNFDPTDADVRMTITEGPGFSAVTTTLPVDSGEKVINNWTLRYNFSVISGAYRTSARAEPSSYQAAAQSVSEYGTRDNSAQTAWIYERLTAERVVSDWMIRDHRARLEVQYLANPATYGIEGTTPLEAGMIVQITDASHSLTSAKAMVTKSRRFGDDLRITLTILDGWG